MIRKILAVLLVAQVFLSFSQDKKKSFRFGLEMNTYCSTALANGLNLKASLFLGKHQFSLGPRLTYNRILGRNTYLIDITKTHQDLKGIVDFDYRYRAFDFADNWSFFCKLNIAYYHHRHDYERFHDPQEASPAFEVLFPNDTEGFNLRSDQINNTLFSYLGVGVNHTFGNRLYLTSSVGIGFPVSIGRQSLSNVNSGENYVDQNILTFDLMSHWKLDFGVGIRFGH